MAEVNRREIYRYLGIKGQQEPDLQTKDLVEDCLEELERSVNCRSFYRRYPLTLLPDSELDFTCFKVKSRALSRNLKDCQEVILFAATLGAGVDLLLRRYSRLSMSRAVVLQACAAARIESYCNEINDKLKAEVTPHHFTLDETAVLEYGTLAKMNPPLRSAADREALIEAIKDGTIDMIATDHAPHSAEEKAKPLTEAPSGIIGLETSLPLAVTRLVKAGHIDYLTLFEKMCLNPAKLYRMKEAGRIREGGAADLVLFDDQTPYTVEKFHSKASNSPFVGAKLYGKVHYTICSGETVYRAE